MFKTRKEFIEKYGEWALYVDGWRCPSNDHFENSEENLLDYVEGCLLLEGSLAPIPMKESATILYALQLAINDEHYRNSAIHYLEKLHTSLPKIRERLESEAKIVIRALEECTDIEEYAAGDDEMAAVIQKQLDDGNPWAWCTVAVEVSYGPFAAVEYMGCCSYEDGEDFIKSSGYFEDMKTAALDALAKQIETFTNDIKGL